MYILHQTSTSIPRAHKNSAGLHLPGPASKARRLPDEERAEEPASSLQDVPFSASNKTCQTVDDLPDDVLNEILLYLGPLARKNVGSTCERLLSLANSGFKALKVNVPSHMSRSFCAASSSQSSACSLPSDRFDSIEQLTLEVPLLGKQDDSSAEDAHQPLNAWLSAYLSHGRAGRSLQLLRLMPQQSDHVAQETSERYGPGSPRHTEKAAADHAAAYCSGRVLQMLVARCPNLQKLALPLLAPAAASALPALQGLRSLSFVVHDCGLIDAAVSLHGLTHLSMSTHTNLVYLVLQQSQIEQIAKMPKLRSLHLVNVMLPDNSAAFRPLSVLTALSELSVSYSFCAAQLQFLPHLRSLNLPYFSTSDISHLSTATALTALQCRQTLQEYQLTSLAKLTNLHTLQLHNILLTPPNLAGLQQQQQVQGVLSEADALMRWYSSQQLSSVRVLRIVGTFQWRGELGALFPCLESLHVAAVDMQGQQLPAAVAPFSKLQRLSWPSSRSLPQLLAACPALVSLRVHGISTQQQLEMVVQQKTAWPAPLKELSLNFAGCSSRFKSRNARAVLERHIPTVLQQQLETLIIRDVGSAIGPPQMYGAPPPPPPPGKMVDEGVVIGALAGLPKLKSLRLEGCSALTCTGLAEAVATFGGLPLQKLVVAGCPRVRQCRLDRLAGDVGRPWLQVEWLPHATSC